MRFLAALLLLANLALFAWIYTQPPQPLPEYKPVPVPPGITPLVLLSERQETNATAASPDNAGQASAAISDAAPETAAQVPTDPVPEPQPETVTPPRLCQTIGPLIKVDEVEQIAEQLRASGYEVRQRSGKVREPSGYWVYLPTMPAAEARRIVAELDAEGMTDYFIGKQNYISLGIFRAKDKAGVRLKQIMDLGYKPILDQRYRIRTVHWLDVEATGQPLTGSEVWEKVQAQHTDIRVQRVSCE